MHLRSVVTRSATSFFGLRGIDSGSRRNYCSTKDILEKAETAQQQYMPHVLLLQRLVRINGRQSCRCFAFLTREMRIAAHFASKCTRGSTAENSGKLTESLQERLMHGHGMILPEDSLPWAECMFNTALYTAPMLSFV
jgi:hypothetical protein